MFHLAYATLKPRIAGKREGHRKQCNASTEVKAWGCFFLLFPASIRNALESLLQEKQLPLEKNDWVKPLSSGPSIQSWPRSAVTDG